MRKGYIYVIENIVNGKKYIGQTCNYKKRHKEHFYSLENNKHINSHLQSAYNKYGKDNFNSYILSEVSVEDVFEEEKKWISYYNTFKGDGYNLTIGGEGTGSGENHPLYGSNINKGSNNPMFGKQRSEESNRKTSESIRKYSDIHYIDVFDIMKLYFEEELTQSQIAYIYNSSESIIGEIINLDHWTVEDLDKRNLECNSKGSKIDYKDVFKIIKLYFEENMYQSEIADKFNVKQATISRVLNLTHWTTKDIVKGV